MKHPLDRILRLRSLLEEISRIELEARLQEVTRIEGGLKSMQQNHRHMQQLRHEAIVQADGNWQEAHVMGEWLAGEALSLEPVLEWKEAEAEVAKAFYLERRKEHRQIESVIEAEVALATIERSRREQQELDDWFGQRKQKSRLA